jgi:Carbohydrate binding domain
MTLHHRSLRLACLGLPLTAALSSFGQTPAIPPAYKAAADVTITTAVAAPNPGGFTATFENPPIENLLVGGEYEGFNFRDRLYAGGDAADSIPMDATISTSYDTRREGFFDGATARIYRIINGKLTSVRQAKITKHRASGWQPAIDNKIVPPDRTSYQWNFDGYNSPVAPYYFAVVAVAEDGSHSVPSNFVEVKRPENCEVKAVNDGLKDFKAPEAAAGSAPGKTPPAPANFKSTTAADGVVTFTWDAVKAPGIAGYLVLRSDYAPTKHLGHGFDLADKASGPEQQIKKGDLVFLDLRRNSWNRNQYASNRVWAADTVTGLPSIFPGHPGESANHTWSIEPHPGQFPAEFSATERGRGALKLTMSGSEEVALKQYNYAGPQQNWYHVLKPGRTYVVEFWARPEGMEAPSIRFELNQIYTELSRHDFALSPGEWKKYSCEFTPDKEFPAGNENVGQMLLSFNGPGTLWLDAWRIFPKDTGYMKVKPAEIEDLRNSGMAFLRTHGFIKSGWSYFLEDLTNAPGVLASRGVNSHTPPTTLFSALEFMKQAGVNPWLQIEMSLDEREWQGFVEYLAAPYDPAKDSPQSKPWAFKRYSMGQQKPWTDVFPKFIFEVSNELWNPFAMAPWNFPWQNMTDGATGRVSEGGELSGLMTGYIQSQLKKSPYWSTLGPKMETVTGGWLAQLDDKGFGQSAVKVNPDIQHNQLQRRLGRGCRRRRGQRLLAPPRPHRRPAIHQPEKPGVRRDPRPHGRARGEIQDRHL